MKTNWKVNPLWVGLAVAAAGTAIAIEGTLWSSVPIAITGIAIAMAAPAAWVLWAVGGMFLSLWTRLRRQHPPQPTRKIQLPLTPPRTPEGKAQHTVLRGERGQSSK